MQLSNNLRQLAIQDLDFGIYHFMGNKEIVGHLRCFHGIFNLSTKKAGKETALLKSRQGLQAGTEEEA
ncbi:MAG: hypothetical protein ACYS3N_22955 [Planctomycetota bacterium]|jgi:hypothetical protein